MSLPVSFKSTVLKHSFLQYLNSKVYAQIAKN